MLGLFHASTSTSIYKVFLAAAVGHPINVIRIERDQYRKLFIQFADALRFKFSSHCVCVEKANNVQTRELEAVDGDRVRGFVVARVRSETIINVHRMIF